MAVCACYVGWTAELRHCSSRSVVHCRAVSAGRARCERLLSFDAVQLKVTSSICLDGARTSVGGLLLTFLSVFKGHVQDDGTDTVFRNVAIKLPINDDVISQQAATVFLY